MASSQFDDDLRQKILNLIKEGIHLATHPTPTADELMDDSQASKMLGLAKGTMAVWRTQGKGPAYVKIGANVRYRYGDIQDYILSKKQRH